jgi:hypothetical protein
MYAGGNIIATGFVQATANVEGQYVVGNITTTGGSPANNSPGAPGQILFDSTYMYLCISSGLWKRIPLEAF